MGKTGSWEDGKTERRKDGKSESRGVGKSEREEGSRFGKKEYKGNRFQNWGSKKAEFVE